MITRRFRSTVSIDPSLNRVALDYFLSLCVVLVLLRRPTPTITMMLLLLLLWIVESILNLIRTHLSRGANVYTFIRHYFNDRYHYNVSIG